MRTDMIEETSRQSFPASDPPSWTGLAIGPCAQLSNDACAEETVQGEPSAHIGNEVGLTGDDSAQSQRTKQPDASRS